MRAYRLVIFLLPVYFASCQTVSTTTAISTNVYEEDLSVHRPGLRTQPVEKIITASTRTAVPQGHIMEAMDSINVILANRNLGKRIEDGFVIQVYNGTSRTEANSSIGRVRLYYPELSADISYFQPDYRVKAGFFVDRVQAYSAYEKVREKFPEALLVPGQREIIYD